MVAASSQRILRPAIATIQKTWHFERAGLTKGFHGMPASKHLLQNYYKHNCRNFSSLLSTNRQGIARMDSIASAKQMPTTTLAYLKQTEAMLEQQSTQHAKEIAESVGVRLTPNELTTLRDKLADSTSMKEQMRVLSQQALERKATREICLSVIGSNDNSLDKWGVRVINFFDYLGTALFAVVGAQVAGDAGMNLVGCTLVGCAAAMGGGSLNALLYGGTNPLLGSSPGVRWVANPSFLVVAMVAAMATFFVWPYYCQTQANRYIEEAIGKEDTVDGQTTISRETFLAAWHQHPSFQQAIRDALPKLKHRDGNDGNMYFDYIDADSSGDIDRRELQIIVQERFHNGKETFWLDTFGLTSLSLANVVGAIRCGLHPFVAATSGVTVCFGGVIRDLLCGREELKIGTQSYAFATGASSATYVLLRELTIRRILILPLVVRTFISASACIGLRGYEYLTGKPILRPMHAQQ